MRRRRLPSPPVPEGMVYRNVDIHVGPRRIREMWLIPARMNHLWSRFMMRMLTPEEAEEFGAWYETKMMMLRERFRG